MRILFDECVPWPLQKYLQGHNCTTVTQRGWGGFKNGDLLRKAEAQFDLFITADQNLRYQQNLSMWQIAILELSTNDLRRVQAASVSIQAAVEAIQPGQFRRLDIP